jgi:hypothetical protein
MDLWRYRFAELTGGLQPVGDSVPMPVPMDFGTVTPFDFDVRYGTAPIIGGMGLKDQALVRKRADGNWECIGIYLGDSMIVWQDGRRGLGTHLFLRCMEHRNAVPITNKLTRGGMSVARRAHKTSIQHAPDAGEAVPPEVLNEYGFSPQLPQPPPDDE